MTIIHVCRKTLVENAKSSEHKPPLVVRRYNDVIYCNEVIIHGPSRLVYKPATPAAEGVVAFIETEAEVDICM